jgi:hypothetical protein
MGEQATVRWLESYSRNEKERPGKDTGTLRVLYGKI